MPKTEAIVWTVLFLTEALAIVVGNLFSIVQFAETGQLYRRSSYLLINLAAADILVGASAIPMFVCLVGGQGLLWSVNIGLMNEAFTAIDVLCGLGSILSLTLVSLERLSATLWPLRHRLLKTHVYVVGITFVWFLACVTTATGTIMRYASPSVNFLFKSSVVILSICCVTIFVTNFVIWMCVGNKKILSHYRNAATQERRLTITLLIVTLVSLTAWLPFTVINIVNYYHPFSLSATLIYATKLLHYGNSCANVFVYSWKIVEFREALEKVFCCHVSVIGEAEADLHRTRMARLLSRDTTSLETGILASKVFSDYKTRRASAVV